MEKVIVVPSLTVSSDEGHCNDCPICLETVVCDKKSSNVVLKCDHVFHRHCFQQHFKSRIVQNLDVDCPLCRNVVFKNVIVQDDTRQYDGMSIENTDNHFPISQGTIWRSEHVVSRWVFIIPMGIIYLTIVALLIWALYSKYS